MSRSSCPNNIIQFKCLYVLELTVGFESNLNSKAVRKKEKYLNLIKEMGRNYRCVKFINLSVSSLGIFSYECCMFLDMMNDIGVDKMRQHYIIKKMINIAIRATYYIFCCRNKSWDSPDLIQLNWIFFFWIIQSQAANCKLPIHSEINNIVHSKTQIYVSIAIITKISFEFNNDVLINIILISRN